VIWDSVQEDQRMGRISASIVTFRAGDTAQYYGLIPNTGGGERKKEKINKNHLQNKGLFGFYIYIMLLRKTLLGGCGGSGL
jgi:hypothetical protein